MHGWRPSRSCIGRCSCSVRPCWRWRPPSRWRSGGSGRGESHRTRRHQSKPTADRSMSGDARRRDDRVTRRPLHRRTSDMAMPSDQFGAKPAVLRCARCGKFVDWEDAHVQVVCTCRQRFDLPLVLVREATDPDRAAAQELFHRDFGRTKIGAFGEVVDVDQMPALVALMYSDPSGALAYRLLGDALHIVALATDPMWQRSGVGGHLLAEAELLARRLELV